jgi:hypothetical protein
VRASLGVVCFVVSANFEISQEVLRIQHFRFPDLFSQPLQLGKLLEEIGGILVQKQSLYFESPVTLRHCRKP